MDTVEDAMPNQWYDELWTHHILGMYHFTLYRVIPTDGCHSEFDLISMTMFHSLCIITRHSGESPNISKYEITSKCLYYILDTSFSRIRTKLHSVFILLKSKKQEIRFVLLFSNLRSTPCPHSCLSMSTILKINDVSLWTEKKSGALRQTHSTKEWFQCYLQQLQCPSLDFNDDCRNSRHNRKK